MKSHLRFSKASGTTLQRVDKLLRLGWAPGVKIGDLLSRKGRRGRGKEGCRE